MPEDLYLVCGCGEAFHAEMSLYEAFIHAQQEDVDHDGFSLLPESEAM